MTEIKEHRVSNIGQYNRFVSWCGMCYSEFINILGSDCVGFGEPPFASGKKAYAIVYECPACFERQWSHGDIGCYNTYLRHLKRDKDAPKLKKSPSAKRIDATCRQMRMKLE